ncbi:MAG: hypothetical protein QOG87_2685 [Actinomycetota bacterium]|jgi:uncharacterized protein (TIGR03083 family)
MSPLLAVDLLARTWDSLDPLLAELSEDEWKTPTDCPGWSVQDNVSHLIDYESRALGRPGPDHQVGDLPHLKNPMGSSNEIGVDWRRQFSGADVLAEFRDVMAARREQLESLTAEDLAQEVQTPIGPGTLADMLQLRLMDTWSHEQDIRRAVGRPGHASGPAADGAVAYFTKMLPYVVGKKAGAPDGATVVFEVDDRVIPIEVSGGRARTAELAPETATVRVGMDTATFAALVNGRTTSLDGVTLDGDTDLGQRVATNMGVMP